MLKNKWIKRVILIVLCLAIVGTGTVFAINGYVKMSVSDYLVEKTDKVDCILVLGAGLTPEGKPSLVLTDRLKKAIDLYKQGVSNRMLMTGDHGKTDYNEVKAMKQYALEAGVPEEAIFMDHAGFSTYESMYRARDIFDIKSVAIVTQPYHEYRAVYIARTLGLDAYGTPSVATKYRGSWILEGREILARNKEFFNLMIQPKPTYLGEKIPISGNGISTDDDKKEAEA